MHKICRFAIAISLTAASLYSYADSKEIAETLPELSPEGQHAEATKRIKRHFTRAHYKSIDIDDELSTEIFDYYLKQLDYSRNVFLAADIEGFEKYRFSFDELIKKSELNMAYDMFNLNLQRRLERYEFALSQLVTPFDFTKDESYNFDREDAQWPRNIKELNELWRIKVKYDALNLTLAGKEWAKVQEILTKRYKYAIKRLKQSESEDVFQTVMNSFSRVVEPHTSYLSPRNAERFQMEMNLSLEGIGAVLRSEEDYTVIQSVVAGGPADKSKALKSKDKIVGVAQADKEFVDIIGWRLDDVVDLIKGPKGTQVRLQIQSGETDDAASLKVVSMIRDTIKLEDRAAKSEVYYENNKDNAKRKLGVISIPSFYNNLSRDVRAELDKLKAENVEGIIVDLRGNGGGSLTESILLTGLFIDKGPVVQVRDGADRVQEHSDKDGFSYYNGPLTVMVDRNSASASEIFSAAIQDYGRGVIIGEHTFGKGTVQHHRTLQRPLDLYSKPLGSIQFTTAKFYRINGGSTQHRGVWPDIAFPSAIDPKDWGESKEENALPWDQISQAKYRKIEDIDNQLTHLTTLHKERIKSNPEFNYLLVDIVEYNKEKNDKTVSLNLKERQSKKDARKAKQLVRANERLALLGKEPIVKLDDAPDELSELDPFLDEAAKITFDLVNIGKVAVK